ncbi:MAG: Coenzyme F420 hydrogenase/dehydrogenase, beta subunit C-terminal domain, partial [Solobacterium sp.]|nr:Coenzyme F420 hydrogenase/dehydrogenase, beta subunit C-terminal domain [Solobacterium sp.]
TVLDPTLMLTGEAWRQRFHVEKSRREKPYLLVYMLGENEEHQRVIQETARLLQLQILRIPVHEKDLEEPDCLRGPAGPDAFLSYMDGASYVCTDSLHGMIFCHLFHRPFTAFERFGKHDSRNQNSRVRNLLAVTGMEDRLYRSGSQKQIASAKADFSAADEKLALMREASYAYLRQALDQAGKASSGMHHVMADNSLCCGCGSCQEACPVHAVKIVLNKDGFRQAEVDESRCIQCGRCTDVCPFCGQTKNVPAQSASLFAYQSSSQDELKRSSSGGAAYHIARLLLTEGYVIGGCRFNQEKQQAEHILVQDEEGLRLLQGSKYIQSDFASLPAQLKELSSPAAVFGTPCQIAGMKRLFKDRQDIVYIDLVCHGVPTAFLFEKYREYLHKTYGLDTERMNMSFRYKEMGWSSIHLHADDGQREYCCPGKEDPFFRMFEVGSCYNRACYECRWRKDAESDIRLADYWGPRFKDDKAGVSMVIGFSEKGRAIIRKLAESGWGRMEEEPIEDYLLYQQSENLLEPVFYDALIRQLREGTHDLPALVEKYVLPLENRQLSSFAHIVYAMKMMRFKE